MMMVIQDTINEDFRRLWANEASASPMGYGFSGVDAFGCGITVSPRAKAGKWQSGRVAEWQRQWLGPEAVWPRGIKLRWLYGR